MSALWLILLTESSGELINRMAELHGGQYVKEFAYQMFAQLGMRVLVLSAHHDTTGTLSIARHVCLFHSPYLVALMVHSHDYNEDLSGASMEDIHLGWEGEAIMKKWARYVKSQMGE